jgi:hypothetical protein
MPRSPAAPAARLRKTPKPIQLAKGDKVKITYEKKRDGNAATSVTLAQKAGE